MKKSLTQKQTKAKSMITVVSLSDEQKKRGANSKKGANGSKSKKQKKDPTTVRNKVEIGTVVLKFFPNHGWYVGRVEEVAFYDDEVVRYKVLYQDNDVEEYNECNMDEIVQNAQRRGITEVPPDKGPVNLDAVPNEASAPSSLKKQTSRKEAKFKAGTLLLKRFDSGLYIGTVLEVWCDSDGEPMYKVLYHDEDGEDLDEDMLEVFVKDARRKGITTMPNPSPNAGPFKGLHDFEAGPEGPLLKELEDNEYKLRKLKKEKKKGRKNTSSDPLESLPPERREERKRWIKANTDPRTGEGRHVFRRATGPHNEKSIVEVLGGNGMHACPVVKEARNPQFVKAGEFFFAGRCDFNPWGPKYIGDHGLLDAEFFDDDRRGNQENFHLFEMCHQNKLSTRYQGPDARVGYFYAGIYRLSKSGVELTVTLNMAGLDETRWAHAEFMHRRQKRETFFYTNDRGEGCPIIPSTVLQEFSSKAEEIHQEDWAGWSQTKREIAAWAEMLYEYKYEVYLQPIEYVGYDEKLYEKLVAEGASKGQVAIRHEDLGIF